jgi:nucleoside-diphosphate-sugar epimerase
LPRWILSALAEAGKLMTLAGRQPSVTPEMVEGLSQEEVVDSSKAIRELGYETPDLRSMLERALAWQVDEAIVPRRHPPSSSSGPARAQVRP